MNSPSIITAFGRANYAAPSTVPDERFARLSRFRQVRGWEAGLRSFGRQLLRERPPRAADLAELALPTLILWGEADIFIPSATGERLAAVIPQAHLISYPDCGHIPWEGCRSSFVPDLVAFLQRSTEQ